MIESKDPAGEMYSSRPLGNVDLLRLTWIALASELAPCSDDILFGWQLWKGRFEPAGNVPYTSKSINSAKVWCALYLAEPHFPIK